MALPASGSAFNINHSSTIHGGQTNIFNQVPHQSSNPTRDRPCISPVLSSPVSTYVDRPTLSEEIAAKMQKSCGNQTLVHALAVTGLGGAGKTQLVLKYIHEHKQRYDTILLIDAHDEGTVRSSFERCCNALSIPFGQQSASCQLQDAAPVQELLQWLASREKDQKWLVVFDNADTFGQLSLIMPSNKLAGSVIITSQDRNAIRILPRSRSTVVDKMEIEEAKTLLARCMEIKLSTAHWKVMSLLEKVANRLDGIALAIDLAGACMRDDMEIDADDMEIEADDMEIDADDMEIEADDMDIEADKNHVPNDEGTLAALERYLVNLEQHKRSILSDPEQNDLSSYKKTVWTLWGTVLDSLKESEDADAERLVFPLHLLKLAAFLGPNIIHRELFRSASQSLSEICAEVNVKIPEWFTCLLRSSKSGRWDSFSYTETINRLERFHLVRPAIEEVWCDPKQWDPNDPMQELWPGITMHGLVRWRTGAESTQGDYELCRHILVAACCHSYNEVEGGVDFRRILSRYIPDGIAARQLHGFTPKGLAELHSHLGTALSSLWQLERAKKLLVAASDFRHRVFGGYDSTTVQIDIELSLLCRLRSVELDNEGEDEKGQQSYEEHSRRIKRLPRVPEAVIMLSAALANFDLERPGLVDWIEHATERPLRAKAEVKQEVIDEFNREKKERAEAKIASLVVSLADGRHHLGNNHHAVIRLMSSLARAHSYGALGLEQRYLEEAVVCARQSFGTEHLNTMQFTERLAFCKARLLNSNTTTEMMKKLCQLSRDVLGDDDPRTRCRERHLDQFKGWKSEPETTFDGQPSREERRAGWLQFLKEDRPLGLDEIAWEEEEAKWAAERP